MTTETSSLKQTDTHCPQLPLPNLTTLLKRYIEFLEPLDGVKDKQSSINFVQEVLKSLQDDENTTSPEFRTIAKYFRFLESIIGEYKNFCNTTLRTSHMAPLWNAMYLGNREPLPLGWNYMLHLDGPSLETVAQQMNVSSQALRAAVIGAASFQVRRLVEQPLFFSSEAQSRLPRSCRVDLTLCRDQYNRLFRTVRIPHLGMDGLRWSHTNKVLLLRKGYAFILSWIHFEDSDNVNLLGPHWLEEIVCNARLIQTVIDKTADLPANIESPLVLASGSRSIWAYAFEELWGNAVSKDALDAITSCSFAIALDEETDLSLALHGGKYPENRYPDMNVMYTVDPSGGASCNMEHSWGDGGTMILVCSTIHHYATSLINEKLTVKRIEGLICSDYSDHVKPVCFGTLSNTVLKSIANTRCDHQKRVEQTELTVRHIRAFGTNEIKKNCRVSPDAFVHAAFHLAQRRLFGDQRSTYCALMMKKYHHGRTETLRTVTRATQELALMMESVDNKNIFNSSIAAALQKSSKEHRKRISVCRAGQGFHRAATLLRRLHNEVRERLQCMEKTNVDMKLVQAAESVESYFFASSALKELSSDYLSTSNITANGISSFSFAATHPNGVGIGYSLFPKILTFTCSSYKSFARPISGIKSIEKEKQISVCNVYADTLEQAVHDLYSLTAVLPPPKL
ncbi:putative carnitine O-palmitoyltransferase [Trypanosoma theileri]|uniref:Putative carnitine O-palmitoyltransferase n=1 Tax=Trypanosoma theileri TaxID=67003 RepID=A0A1X0NR41_9TRYP|nr:putative carnitine O-palmitoyltransferase [Trypanosoma theileri]ORC86639.1 putative carnitine O-palmitoyltransferase [Trypanosoma theileri]